MRGNVCWALALILALPALAAAKDKNKEKDKKKDKGQDATIVFTVDDRDTVQGYFVEKHGRGKCPPGLAKKQNGCLPPGQAKKRYTVGHPLPPTIVVQELPADLVVRIGVAPPGYRYAMIDGDVVKLAVGTALVVDAIQGLLN